MSEIQPSQLTEQSAIDAEFAAMFGRENDVVGIDPQVADLGAIALSELDALDNLRVQTDEEIAAYNEQVLPGINEQLVARGYKAIQSEPLNVAAIVHMQKLRDEADKDDDDEDDLPLAA